MVVVVLYYLALNRVVSLNTFDVCKTSIDGGAQAEDLRWHALTHIRGARAPLGLISLTVT